MSDHFNIDYKELKFNRDFLPTAKVVKTLKGSAQHIIIRHSQNYEQGKDTTGKRFKPYSSAYARKLLKSGIGHAKVTLRRTGRLLGSRKIKEIPNGVEVGFAGQHRAGKKSIPNSRLAAILNASRPFHNVAKEDRKIALKDLTELYRREIKNLYK